MNSQKELIQPILKKVQFGFAQVKPDWKEQHSEQLRDLSESLIIDNHYFHLTSDLSHIQPNNFQSVQLTSSTTGSNSNLDRESSTLIDYEMLSIVEEISISEDLFELSSSTCSSVSYDKCQKEVLASFCVNELEPLEQEKQNILHQQMQQNKSGICPCEQQASLGTSSTTFILGSDNKYRILSQTLDASFLSLIRRSPSEVTHSYLRFGQSEKSEQQFSQLKSHIENSLLSLLSCGSYSLSLKTKYRLNSEISVTQIVSTLPEYSNNSSMIDYQMNYNSFSLPQIFKITQSYTAPIQKEEKQKSTTLLGLFYSKEIRKRTRLSRQSSIFEDSYLDSASKFAAKYYTKQLKWKRRGKNLKSRSRMNSSTECIEESDCFSNITMQESYSICPSL